ncbi:MAG: Spy/CpxP family protein refolding chaperone [Phycisphaerales bacterium]|nr:Spy/CpxP family protein refolding chaperone [Phycisphaerales bacterium]
MKSVRAAELVRAALLATGMAVAALGPVVGLTPDAIAQPGGGRGEGRGGGPGGGMGFGGGMREMMSAPVISARDLERVSGRLGLAPEQLDVVKTLHEGFAAQARQITEAMQTQMEKARDEFRESRDPEVFQSLRPAMEKARADRKKAEQEFMSDVQAVLTPEQQAKWPSFERGVRRETTLRQGLMSGERVDLFRLVERLELAPEAMEALRPALDGYEADLDRELVTRAKVYEESMEKMSRMRDMGDMEAMQDVIEKGREASVRVRDVNRRYARQVADLLPSEKRSAFEADVKRESFPDVYRESQATRSFNAAMGFADLSAEQREQLLAMRESYTRTLDTLNTKLAAAIEENEMTFNISQMMQRRGEESPMGQLRTERRDLDRATIEKLRGILTEAQVEKLPQPEQRGEGRGRGDQGERRQRGQGEMAPRDPF